jgi:hypothetical protein
MSISPTPSQYLFSMWKDLCGGTNVCSGVRIQLTNVATRQDFWDAYCRFFEQAKPLHLSISCGADSYDELQIESSYFYPPPSSAFDCIEWTGNSADDVATTSVNSLLAMSLGGTAQDNHFLKIVHCSPSDVVILLVVEHLFADGLGVDQLLRAFLVELERVLSVSSGSMARSDLPVGVFPAYSNYVESLSPFVIDYCKSSMIRRFFWSPGKAPIKHMQGQYKMRCLSLSTQHLEQITILLSEHSISLFSYLTCCFARAFFHSQIEEPELLLQIPTHGRTVGNLSIGKEYVGCFAQSFLLHFERNELASRALMELEQRIQDYSTKCLINEVDQITARRSSRSLRQGNLRKRVKDQDYALGLRRNMPTNVYFSFYGQTGVELESSTFSIGKHYLGTTNLSGGVDVVAVLTATGLEVSINYDSLFFGDDVITRLADQLSTELHTRKNLANFSAPTYQIPSTNVDNGAVAFLDLVNEYSVSTVTLSDRHRHLEIHLGLDSLAKTQIYVRALALFALDSSDVPLEPFYRSVTLDEWFELFLCHKVSKGLSL